MAYETEIDPFGNTAWDNVVYDIDNTPTGKIIDEDDWIALQNLFNQEVSRRRNEDPNFGTAASTGVIIDDVHYNDFANAMNSLNAYYVGAPGGAWAGICSSNNPNGGIWHCNKKEGYVPVVPHVSPGQLITAAQINRIKDELKKAGNSCFCNCNYCACNCNFCTCNCNFSCTCHCNYSDERLKTNILYL